MAELLKWKESYGVARRQNDRRNLDLAAVRLETLLSLLIRNSMHAETRTA